MEFVHEELGLVAKVAAMLAGDPPGSIDDLVSNERYAFLWEAEQIRWNRQSGANGVGQTAFALVRRDRRSGYLSVFFALEGEASAPRHVHTAGEFIMVFLGQMMDRGGDRTTRVIGHSDAIVHGWGSEHAPVPSPGCKLVVGWYVQPGGSRLVEATQPALAEIEAQPFR